MSEQHPNIVLLSQLDLGNLDASADLFSEQFVWHYFNPNLPEVEGDYVGVAGLTDFFAKLGAETSGTFKVNPISATPIGEELVVVHVRNSMELDGEAIAIDAAVVWRFVDGKIAEAWDIPSVHTLATSSADGVR
ncbi:MAG: nuclear transport factor 2 family protein [Pseudomonadota bacterium]